MVGGKTVDQLSVGESVSWSGVEGLRRTRHVAMRGRENNRGLCVQECRFHNSAFLPRGTAGRPARPGPSAGCLSNYLVRKEKPLAIRAISMHPAPSAMHRPSSRKLNACTSASVSTSRHPSSPIFLSLNNWITSCVRRVHCALFRGFLLVQSSSQSGWEGTGEASRHLWAAWGGRWRL